MAKSDQVRKRLVPRARFGYSQEHGYGCEHLREGEAGA